MPEGTALALRRMAQMAAIFMIGDGVLGLALPRRHVALWRSDVRALDTLVRAFAGYARRRRGYGAVQVAAGLVLASAVTR